MQALRWTSQNVHVAFAVDYIEHVCTSYCRLHRLLIQALRWTSQGDNVDVEKDLTKHDRQHDTIHCCRWGLCCDEIVNLCCANSLFAVWFWLNSIQEAFCLFCRVNLTVVFLCFCLLILLHSICCAGMRDQQLDALGCCTSSTIFECPWKQRQPTGAVASQGAPFWLMPLRGTAHTNEALVLSTNMF